MVDNKEGEEEEDTEKNAWGSIGGGGGIVSGGVVSAFSNIGSLCSLHPGHVSPGKEQLSGDYLVTSQQEF